MTTVMTTVRMTTTTTSVAVDPVARPAAMTVDGSEDGREWLAVAPPPPPDVPAACAAKQLTPVLATPQRLTQSQRGGSGVGARAHTGATAVRARRFLGLGGFERGDDEARHAPKAQAKTPG